MALRRAPARPEPRLLRLSKMRLTDTQPLGLRESSRELALNFSLFTGQVALIRKERCCLTNPPV